MKHSVRLLSPDLRSEVDFSPQRANFVSHLSLCIMPVVFLVLWMTWPLVSLNSIGKCSFQAVILKFVACSIIHP